jgi:hypothetical protein
VKKTIAVESMLRRCRNTMQDRGMVVSIKVSWTRSIPDGNTILIDRMKEVIPSKTARQMPDNIRISNQD